MAVLINGYRGARSGALSARSGGLLLVAVLLLAPSPAAAHYPYPYSTEEREKAAVIREAVERGDRKAVETLVALLKQDAIRVQTAAFLALGELSGKGLDMRGAIAEAERLRKVEANGSALYLKAAADVALVTLSPTLSEAGKRERLATMSADADGAVRRMAVEALKVIGDESCLPALERRINDSFGDHDDAYDMRAVARVAFEAWWSVKRERLPAEQWAPVVLGSLAKARPFASRWADAACDLLENMDPTVIPVLIAACEETSSGYTRQWALRTLGNMDLDQEQAAQARAIALRGIENENSTVRHLGVRLLGQHLLPEDGQHLLPEDTDLLVDLLARSADPTLRNFAATQLERLDGPKARQALRQALGDENEMTRVNAAKALARLGDKEGHAILLETFGSLMYGPRTVALGAAPLLDPEQVVARIVELLPEDYEWKQEEGQSERLVQIAKADLLRELGRMRVEQARPAIPVLKRLLRDPESDVSHRAASMLRQYGFTLEWKYDVEQKRGWFEIEAEGQEPREKR